MSTKRLMAAITLLAVAAAGSHAAAAEPIPGASADPESPRAHQVGDVCEGCHKGYYWTIDGWFSGNESYRVYCDPAACSACAGGWKPTSVSTYLYWDRQNACALTVSATIQEAVADGSGCPRPGRLVATSEPIVVGPFSPAGLWGVTIPLPPETPVLSGSFFATLTFHDTCAEPPSLVANAGPCLACASWVDRGAGWEPLCGDAFPGNLSVRTSLQCQGVSPIAESSWSTVKGKYRPGEE
jgi:hypothetical protein